jgi:phospholipid-binding lipoprotein MlaA
LAALGFAAACLATPSVALAQTPVQDPWEGLNRKLYAVNDVLDRGIFEPIARGYRAIAPRPIRRGVTNVLNNLHGPVVFVNNLLQGRPGEAGKTAARFGLNTTVGVLGLFDPAADMGLPRRDEDFGQTLGTWGARPGPYLFLPVMGPSSVRDSIGGLVDLAFDPLNWARFHHANSVRITRAAATAVSAREGLLDSVDNLRRTSIDPYVSVRSSYALLRESAIRNDRRDVQDLPDLQDIPEEPEAPGEAPPEPQQTPSEQPSQPETSVPPVPAQIAAPGDRQ